MQINPKTVKKQFEKNMPNYNKNAVVQLDSAKKLVQAVLNHRSDFNNILELGCGTGLLTQEVIKNLSFKKYFANDLIKKSKNYLDKFLPDYTFICGNAQKISPNCKMDLIISNAVFQWFGSLENAARHFANILEKDGILAFSTFSAENYKEIRNITGLSLDYKSIEETEKALSNHFTILHKESYTQTLKFSTPLELLAHMKNTGVNSLSATRWTFKDVKDFCDKYIEKYPQVTLTYAPVVFAAKLK